MKNKLSLLILVFSAFLFSCKKSSDPKLVPASSDTDYSMGYLKPGFLNSDDKYYDTYLIGHIYTVIMEDSIYNFDVFAAGFSDLTSEAPKNYGDLFLNGYQMNKTDDSGFNSNAPGLDVLFTKGDTLHITNTGGNTVVDYISPTKFPSDFDFELTYPGLNWATDISDTVMINYTSQGQVVPDTLQLTIKRINNTTGNTIKEFTVGLSPTNPNIKISHKTLIDKLGVDNNNPVVNAEIIAVKQYYEPGRDKGATNTVKMRGKVIPFLLGKEGISYIVPPTIDWDFEF